MQPRNQASSVDFATPDYEQYFYTRTAKRTVASTVATDCIILQHAVDGSWVKGENKIIEVHI